jgi:hypothetical protein
MTGARALRIHAWAYAMGACALSAANWLTGSPWWSFWPLAGWAVLLAGHYLVTKTETVDERWTEERTAEVHAKSYDVSHIDSIARDQPGNDADPGAKQ